MDLRIPTLSALTLLALVSSSTAQTVFPEVEPNGTKAEATPASCLVAGDSLSGMTTGTAITAGNSALTSADTFRVMTCTAPLGVYRHTLTLTASAGGVPTATIRGLNQTAGVIGTTDSAVVTSSGALVAWYGFGKQEEIYYRVTGTTSTTGTYSATLATTPITPTAVPGVFNPGTIVINCGGQGHTTDTDLWLYDSNFNAIPCGGDDDNIGPPTSLQSRLSISLAAGTYYLGISTYNLANNQPSCAGVDNFLTGLVLDFPNAVADSSTTTATNISFSVSDGTNTVAQPATKALIFGVEWFRIQVGSSAPAPTPFCFGDGSGTACPCANNGTAGNGCASSVNANGANLAWTGTASIANDTLVLQGTGMPSSSALYFQGTVQVSAGAGGTFGDGKRCAGGSVIRLGTKTNVGGSSAYPEVGNPSVHVKGSCNAGDVREYQCWYRNAAAFCTPSTFNLTNGLEVTWAP
jgi:hypothetical protein